MNWKGKKLYKKNRGFSTKKEALNWERELLLQQVGTIEMTFREFFELYKRDNLVSEKTPGGRKKLLL